MGLEADSNLVYRPYCADDVAFVYSSWGRSYYKGSGAHKQISPDEFHSFHRPIIDKFFSRPAATVIVVHHADEPSVIIGWIAVEILQTKLMIHYIYIKATFRRRGLLWEMINRIDPVKPIVFTHLTTRFARIMARNPDKYQRFKYLPLS